jgi:hypothetical protein
VEVVLTAGRVEGPGRAREGRPPVGRLRSRGPCVVAGAGRSPPAPVPLGLSGPVRDSMNHGCSSEVWLTTQVHDQLHAPVVQAGHEGGVEIGQGPEDGVDGLVVADVLAVVVLGQGVDGRQPHHVDSQPGQVVQPGGEARQIAHPVTVGVGEAARVHLVHDVPLPWLGPLARAPGGTGRPGAGSGRPGCEAPSNQTGGGRRSGPAGRRSARGAAEPGARPPGRPPG